MTDLVVTDAQIARVFDVLGPQGVICAECGCTIWSYLEQCRHRRPHQPCDGFLTVESVRVGARERELLSS